MGTLTDIWIKEFLNDELEELFGNTALVQSLLPFKLYEKLLLQVTWVLQGHHLQLHNDNN